MPSRVACASHALSVSRCDSPLLSTPRPRFVYTKPATASTAIEWGTGQGVRPSVPPLMIIAYNRMNATPCLGHHAFPTPIGAPQLRTLLSRGLTVRSESVNAEASI